MSEPRLGERAVTALQWGLAGAVLRALAQVVVQLLLARLLGPEAFGQASAAILVWSLGWILSEGGFGHALVQKPRLDDADVGYALGWILLISGTTGLLVAATSPWLARWLGGPELVGLIAVSGLLIPLQALSNLPASLLRRRLDMRSGQIIQVGAYLVSFGAIGLPLAWAGAGAWSLLAANAALAVLTLLGSYAIVRHTLRPRLRGDASIARFGWQVTASNAANWFENIDRLIVTRFWGNTSLGEYTAALNLSRAPAGLLIGPVQSVAFAAASRIQEDNRRLAAAFLSLVSLVSLATAPLFALLGMHAEAVVHLAYGERWTGAAPLFAVFCAALPFYALQSVTGPLLWSIRAVRSDMTIQILSTGLLAVGFLSMTSVPLERAAWVVPSVYAFRAAFLLHRLALRLDVRATQLLQSVAGSLALACVGVGLSLLARSALPPVAALAASAAIAALAALAALRARPAALLGSELTEALRQRAADTAVARWLCRLAGLEARRR